MRGTPAAWNKLVQKNDDTLYFISEADAHTGKLYLGAKEIICDNNVSAATALADLTDVQLPEPLKEGQVLMYHIDGDNEYWTASDIQEIANAIEKMYTVEPQEGEDHLTAITRVVGEDSLNPGDIAIVKELIATGKYSRTSYVYSNLEWHALDGNVNAENVYFAEDLTYTANIGVMSVPSSGSGTIAATGKNVKEVLSSILAKRTLPNRTLPAVSVSAGKCKSYEVGSKVAPDYSASLSTGSYTYGPATGITAKSWNVSFNGETKDTATGTFSEITVADSTSLRITATATYEAGAAPKDNLGNVLTDASELAQKQIQAGSATNYSGTITGFRYLFHGSKATPIELNSVNIRALTPAASTSGSVEVSVVDGAKQVIISVPKGRKITKVADEGAFGTDIFSEFTLQTVSVGGADATADSIGDYAKDYNTYVYAPATALGANTYTVSVANE